MTPEEIKAYCLSKPKAYEDLPFGEVPICYKVNKKIFAQLYPDKITLKCTAFSG
ncbi:MAG: MmcQ/YjbR family DNA-binding protein [Oscillospiraceae bacterium]|nr:MmcQ/YjbR family DNA-binding protein [Oscillospiraceae bacterium]